ncbi:hypothetical protein TNIN_364791 [Trichonephila inaurata madagascariensis]|uniref:Uncharacterized protein n=1 Tax=Trichonephila inaurata madagascariensis TaxID=2747483 RepID=A0A8X7CDX0_9ARAC|nr:hypothetical protein TNIN_364791 [Trichonephila inaurata madagascariensis]
MNLPRLHCASHTLPSHLPKQTPSLKSLLKAAAQGRRSMSPFRLCIPFPPSTSEEREREEQTSSLENYLPHFSRLCSTEGSLLSEDAFLRVRVCV